MKHDPKSLKRHKAEPEPAVAPETAPDPEAPPKAERQPGDEAGAYTRQTSGWSAGGQPSE